MLYTIGIMSGTSLDGVDAALVCFDAAGNPGVEADAFVPYPPDVREAVLALQPVGDNELNRAARLANRVAELYAEAVSAVLIKTKLTAANIAAIGAHGQTIRHAPQLGYTLQLGNWALLAELTGIDVAGDFRSRDIAAGGQGAPLVPAFHQAVFGSDTETRVILNIGGIANLTRLAPGHLATGFDTGPGNMLMDAWIKSHLNQSYDADGAWAASGLVLPELLQTLLAEPFFALSPPKSTGRDLFDLGWLNRHLAQLPKSPRPQDVQATLLELSAQSAASAIALRCAGTSAVYVCGGGAKNPHLMQRLTELLPNSRVSTTGALGLPVHQVEAAAFAWLAYRLIEREPGNLPEVTGAAGLRVLGAIYPR
jgi:anhydro-N-acetylmuramic acid kinase